LEEFITAAPTVAMVVEGVAAIDVVRNLVGDTNGLKALAGTIRGDFSSSQQKNLVHASDGPQAADREIQLFFEEREICPYESTIAPWLKAANE